MTLDTILETVDHEPIDALCVEMERVTNRIKGYRKEYPLIDVSDEGCYLDGSIRLRLGFTPGFHPPTFRMWPIETKAGRHLYVYEEVQLDFWRTSLNRNALGTGKYGLALGTSNLEQYVDELAQIEVYDFEGFSAATALPYDEVEKLHDLREALENFLVNDQAFRAMILASSREFSHKSFQAMNMHKPS